MITRTILRSAIVLLAICIAQGAAAKSKFTIDPFIDGTFTITNNELRLQPENVSPEQFSVFSGENAYPVILGLGVYLNTMFKLSFGYMLNHTDKYAINSQDSIDVTTQGFELRTNMNYLQFMHRQEDHVYGTAGAVTGYKISNATYLDQETDLSGFYFEVNTGAEARYGNVTIALLIYTQITNNGKSLLPQGEGELDITDSNSNQRTYKLHIDNSWGVKATLGIVF